jgi:hypothetical protein
MDPHITIRKLWVEMNETFRTCYPPGVVPVPEPLAGTAFFPGGFGLYAECPPDIMIVGQDFNTIATYEKARHHGSEFDTSTTWRNMKAIFPRLGIPFERCLFTNFFMGLRESGSETGPFPGIKDPHFVQACARFFERQLETVRPRLIVTLGIAPLKLLGKHVFRISTPASLTECTSIYRVNQISVVPLTHPSMYFANIHRRSFQGFTGLEAEKAMVQQAINWSAT